MLSAEAAEVRAGASIVVSYPGALPCSCTAGVWGGGAGCSAAGWERADAPSSRRASATLDRTDLDITLPGGSGNGRRGSDGTATPVPAHGPCGRSCDQRQGRTVLRPSGGGIWAATITVSKLGGGAAASRGSWRCSGEPG